MFLTTLLAIAAPACSAPATQQPVLERFRVDPARSEVGFHGDSTLHAFTGRTRAVRGEIRTLLRDPGALTAGWVRVEAATLDTDDDGRDEKMREHLDVETFPYIDFLITDARGSLDDGAGDLAVDGRFRIHGFERARELTLSFAREGSSLHVQGSAKFPMSQHGIAPPRVAVITVDDAIEVFVDLWLVPVEGEPVAVRELELTVTERLEPVEGEAVESSAAEFLLVAGDVAHWVRPGAGTWIRAAGDGTRSFDLVGDVARPDVGGCEPLFEEARERKERLDEKMSRLPRSRRPRAVVRTIDELERGLALAPAAGEAEVTEADDTLEIALGETVWIRAEGRAGEAAAGGLLLGLEGLPTAVREALGRLDHMPARLSVRTVVPAGVRTIVVRAGTPVEATVPRWAIAPADWIGVSGVGAVAEAGQGVPR